jgi:hypothetical protein
LSLLGLTRLNIGFRNPLESEKAPGKGLRLFDNRSGWRGVQQMLIPLGLEKTTP